MNARILALDPGERRIGVAVSDTLGLTARPLGVIEHTSLEETLTRIRDLIKRHSIKTILVGLPLNMNGTLGPEARRARRFANRLHRETNLEVILWDERLTTVAAERSLLEADERRSERKRVRDAVAAAILLQSYLEAQRNEDRK